jgi:hypothetical protein
LNFRKIKDQQIFGVSQPPISSIRAMLNFIKGLILIKKRNISLDKLERRSEKNNFLEPIIYINEKPFVVRDIEHPFQNLNYYSGISKKNF